MPALPIQSVSARTVQSILRNRREAIGMQAVISAIQQDLVNIYAALRAVELQLDTATVAGNPYAPSNGGPAVNLPSAINDQVLAASIANYPLNLKQ